MHRRDITIRHTDVLLTASASIKDPQTFNRYTYAMNSPYKFTDPLGLIASCCTERLKQIIKEEFGGVWTGDDGTTFQIDDAAFAEIEKILLPEMERLSNEAKKAQDAINNQKLNGGVAPTSTLVTTNANSSTKALELSGEQQVGVAGEAKVTVGPKKIGEVEVGGSTKVDLKTGQKVTITDSGGQTR